MKMLLLQMMKLMWKQSREINAENGRDSEEAEEVSGQGNGEEETIQLMKLKPVLELVQVEMADTMEEDHGEISKAS